MLRITYLSEASEPFTPQALLDLLEQCRRNNPGWGVTGLLIYANGTFLQTVEGEDAKVDALLERIASDPRHRHFRILSRQPISERSYQDWSMGFEQLTEDRLREIPELRNLTLQHFNRDFLSSNSGIVETLLDRHRSRHWDPLIGEIDARDRLIVDLRRALSESQQRIDLAALLLESVVETAGERPLDKSHIELCRSLLASLRSSGAA